jgi:hypothetical protein
MAQSGFADLEVGDLLRGPNHHMGFVVAAKPYKMIEYDNLQNKHLN